MTNNRWLVVWLKEDSWTASVDAAPRLAGENPALEVELFYVIDPRVGEAAHAEPPSRSGPPGPRPSCWPTRPNAWAAPPAQPSAPVRSSARWSPRARRGPADLRQGW